MEGLIVLFDFDSLLYKAVYRIVSIKKIRRWFMAGKTKAWMEKEIVELSINRMHNMMNKIFYEIEETGIIIEHVEFYITYMTDPYRKQWSKTYKKSRKKNKWVTKVRQELIQMDFAVSHPNWEADDLIADRARELGDGKYLILSIDKDMKTVAGIHYDYYTKPCKKAEFGYMPEMRGLSVVTEKEAEYNFYSQMLIGDKGDDIDGVKGIGPVTAHKALSNVECLKSAVKKVYKNHFANNWSNKFYIAYQLLYLGTKREHLL